jgi:hypothetical protein
VAVRPADSILAHATRGVEILELVARIEELEAAEAARVEREKMR